MSNNKSKVVHTVNIPDDYFININDSVLYDYRIIMESNENELTPIEKFVEKVYYSLPLKAPKYATEIKKTALNNIICNAVVSTVNGKPVALPRGRGIYKLADIYGMKHYTYRYIVDGVNALRGLKYLEQWNGYYDKESKAGKRTRIWATEKLLEEIRGFDNIIVNDCIKTDYDFNGDQTSITGEQFTRLRYATPIHLKDENKKRIGFKMTKKILLLKKFLVSYNDFIEMNSITIPSTTLAKNRNTALYKHYGLSSYGYTSEYYYNSTLSPILGFSETKCLYLIKLDCQLYRVFNNGKFDEGGRFYGAEYQGLNEEQRADIKINDNNTVEIDYKAMHPRMLYHLEKIDYTDDSYLAVCDDSDLREPIKKMLQIIINAKNYKAAMGAFREYLEENIEVKMILNKKDINAKRLWEMIRDKHQRINKYFNSGIGVELQYKDSKIAEAILRHFTKQKTPCLCVHDSFIVEEQFKDELIEVMMREYKSEIKYEPQLKVNSKKV